MRCKSATINLTVVRYLNPIILCVCSFVCSFLVYVCVCDHHSANHKNDFACESISCLAFSHAHLMLQTSAVFYQ